MTKKAFSLVELIVVMTVLTILSTIGFFSYSEYTEGTRDTSRVNQLQIIGDGIDLGLAKGLSLIPEQAIVINVEGEKYSTQGLSGKEVLGKIKYFSDGLDPKTKEPFIFSLSSNNKEYDMLTSLDNVENSPKKQLKNNFIYDSNGKLPYVYGKNKVGIFVDFNYVPLNKILTGTLDIDCDTTNNGYKLIFENGLILDPITWQNQFEYGPCYVEDLTSITPPTPPVPVNVSYTDLASLLSGECNISGPTFTANFNPGTGVYNGDLICSGAGIDDTELQFFSIFRRINGTFDLSGNLITNVNPLINLEGVTGDFRLNDNSLINASALGTRSNNNFINIYIDNNELTNLEGIRNLNSVIILDASDNNISDIGSLSSMNNVRILDLSNNNITNIGDIGGRHSLRTLNLSNNNITDLTQLFNLNNLVNLNLSNNNISSIEGIRQKNNLDYLNISGNANITDLSWFNSYTSSSNILQLDTRNYSVKTSSASICNNWTILDQDSTTYPNKSLICN